MFLDHFDNLWINRNAEILGLLNILASFIDFPFIRISNGPIVVGLAILGVQLNSLTKICNSKVKLFFPNIGNAPIVISFHHFRVNLDSFAIIINYLISIFNYR